MMVAFLVFFAATITALQAATLHAVDQLIQPVETINHVYPLDICLATQIGITTSSYVYSIFSCNADKTAVTKTSYGSDSTCADNAEVADTFSDTTLAAGALHSFNCDGELNYVVTTSYTDEDTCCIANYLNPVVVLAATDVCFEYGNGNWSKAACTADGSGTQYQYTTNECVDTDKIGAPYVYAASCSYLETIMGLDVYIRSDKCIANGTRIGCNTLCSEDNCAATTSAPNTTTNTNTNDPTDVMTTNDGTNSHVYRIGLIAAVFALFLQ